MGTIPLPLPWIDWHRAGHPPAFAGGNKAEDCPFCKAQSRVVVALKDVEFVLDDDQRLVGVRVPRFHTEGDNHAA